MKRALLAILLLLSVIPFASAQVNWTWTYTDQCIVFDMALNDNGYIGLAFGYYAELLSPNGYLIFKKPTRGISYTAALSGNNDLVIGTEGKWIQYFNSNGTLLWEYKAKGAITKVDVSKDGKIVVAGDSSGYVYLFRNGKLAWEKKVGNYTWSVDLYGNRIAVGVDNSLKALNLSGKVLFSDSFGGYVRQAIGSNSGIFLRVTAKDGSWSDVGKVSWSGKKLWMRHFNNLVRYIDSDGENVAVGGDIGSLVLLSSNGSVVYKVPFLVSTLQVSTARGYLLAGGAKQAIFVAPNGTVLWDTSFNWSVKNVGIARDASFLAVGYGYHSLENCRETIDVLRLSGTVTPTETTEAPSYRLSGLPLVVGISVGLVLVGYLLWREFRE
ncbi:PQQ-binding-like beta-propeller repeat protein [Thermococcus sp.]|uniref:outer membrane protein assembly factor BamB family protein n=1 Tax=Thermococcus sp. TaxID=35749 RepID=UPI00262749F0|nr:PQQ-binding-like beta-propeller repeat protein [Thermococcus sp.]